MTKRIGTVFFIFALLFSLTACADQKETEIASTEETEETVDYTASAEEISALESCYEGTVALHGEMHDHSNSGGTSDGKVPLSEWKTACMIEKIDFAAILDHRQVLHMYDSSWDPAFFIGGSEAGTLDPREGHAGIDGNKLHYNMVFAEPEGLKNILTEFSEFQYTGGNDGHFTYINFTRERFTELSQRVRDNGGFFVIPHPSDMSSHYLKEDSAECFYYGDYNGMEVLYSKPGTEATEKNYGYWKELLKNGRRVYCCAGGDGHRAPSSAALTTVYVRERTATAILEEQKNGNSTAGNIGIRMLIQDTRSGGHTEFTENGRLIVSVGDFHPSLPKTGKYAVKVYEDETEIADISLDAKERNYFSFPVNPKAKYYRAIVYDQAALDETVYAYGNPIWNDRE